jgi:hypothetical protein
MSSSKKVIYRVGDRVRIENPAVFRRVGYPLGLKEGTDHVLKNYEKDIRDLFRKIDGSAGFEGISLLSRDITVDSSRAFDTVVKELAYSYIKSQGFGGTNREIFIVDVPELKGRIAEVASKKVVMTGTRSPGYGGSCPEDDCQPPYLAYQKSHVLLNLDFPFTFDDRLPYIDLFPLTGSHECWVEAVNLKKVYCSREKKWLEETGCELQAVNEEKPFIY